MQRSENLTAINSWPKNSWYVAGWASEMTTKPLGRKLLNQDVVLYRTESGEVAALEDRCCHTGFPLSHSEVDGEVIRCGYHGLEFNKAGACTKIPGQERIPSAFKVAHYPVVEKDSLIWIWMGDAELADESQIVGCPWHSDSKWGWRNETYLLDCNHEFMNDNLLDLTHVGFVHRNTIGGDPEVHVSAKTDTKREDDKVTVTRWMLDSPPPPTYVKSVGFEGNVDRWQTIEFWPGLLHIYTGATEVGSGVSNDTLDEAQSFGGFHNRIFNGITPVTETSCYYFWSAAHGHNVGDPAVSDAHFSEISNAFAEDKLVLRVQQDRINADPDRPLLNLAGDAGGMAARKILREMIAAETLPIAAE
jgi:phenylpropionate dioxygenase-like ring-hydroxylating dioxygenase large terminal subunit